ncbi:MAG: extracellular solute-binding protein [Endozoicomonas sp.]
MTGRQDRIYSMRCVFLILIIFQTSIAFAGVTISHTFSLIGHSSYKQDFKHFRYVNPVAPKGGTLKLAATGTFDTLNPFIGKGTAPEGLFDTYGKLMVRSADEPYSLYPLIAESIEYPDDYSWVAFHINPAARFSDNHPITASDIVFTFNTLKESGSPFYKNLYQGVTKAVRTGPLRVEFHLYTPGPKLVALLAYMNVLPEHYWKNRPFDSRSLDIPVGSGPMRVASFKRGQSITYERVKDYWGKDIAVNRGRFNFDKIQIDFFRDRHATLEGFRKGLYDFRYEPDITQWHQSYNFPAVKQGKVIRESTPFLYPPGMSALVFNTRRDKFKDERVRKALIHAFDFEWVNNKLLYSEYRRNTSLYANTHLEARGLPAEEERELLNPFRKQLPQELFQRAIELPKSSGTGNNRANQKQALRLLRDAGWQLQNGVMVHGASNTPLRIQLITDTHTQERLLLPFKKSLSDLGIDLTVTALDRNLFRRKARSFDFEMIDWHFWHSMFPGTEQINTWSSRAALEPGSGNIAGVSSPVVDKLLERFSRVSLYEELIPVGRAMDRVLMWGHYMIPKWHTTTVHMAYWNHLEHPGHENLYWWSLSDWWQKPTSR